MERLEARELLAGDLHAALVDGDLRISGGPLSNGLEISAGLTPGTVQLAGLRQAGFATQINHQDGPLTFAVAGDVLIDLGDGDNLLKIDNVCLPGKLKIVSGEGSDTVRIAGAAIARNFVLDTGSGNDMVHLLHTNIHGAIEARLRMGDDYFAMLGCQVRGDVAIDMGWNADRVKLHDSRLGGDLSIESDSVFAPTHVMIDSVEVAGQLKLRTGDGDDFIRLACVTAESLDIETRGGADRLVLDWVAVDHHSSVDL
jgi:hypothetical protein